MFKSGIFIGKGIKKINSLPGISQLKTFGKNERNYSTQNPRRPEKRLFTPGPLGISERVRKQMLRDVGSREKEFISLVSFIRKKLLQIAGVSENDFTVIPMQGSGTFALESAFTTIVPQKGAKVLVLENGAYGKRLAELCKCLSLDTTVATTSETEKFNMSKAFDWIKRESFTHVAMTHCETSSGVINDVEEFGQALKKISPDCNFIVDAMSSFGGIPVDIGNIDVMVSSANKCLQGAPGFGYVFVKKELLKKCKGNSRSISLDLENQSEVLDKTGEFRFTPPTHAMLAFKEALLEFEDEGGVLQRAVRYRLNAEILRNGMERMGFRPLLNHALHPKSYIITSFHYPSHERFNFKHFYEGLYQKDQVIYPGKVSHADCFRIGTIGDIWSKDVEHLLSCVTDVLGDMNIKLPLE